MLRARDVLLRNGFSKREISKVLQASYTTLYRWEKELANK